MLLTNNPIIKPIAGLLNLVEELQDSLKIYKIMNVINPSCLGATQPS